MRFADLAIGQTFHAMTPGVSPDLLLEKTGPTQAAAHPMGPDSLWYWMRPDDPVIEFDPDPVDPADYGRDPYCAECGQNHYYECDRNNPEPEDWDLDYGRIEKF